MHDALDTDILQQFIAPGATVPAIVPVVAQASPERLASPVRPLQSASPVASFAAASVEEVDGGGVRTRGKVSYVILTCQLLLRLV